MLTFGIVESHEQTRAGHALPMDKKLQDAEQAAVPAWGGAKGKGAGTGDGGAKRKPAVLAWGSANGKGVGTADAGKSGATGKPADASVG